MKLTPSVFEEQYRNFITKLLRPLKTEDGISELEISAVEKSLGLELPQILRKFYQLVGNWDEFTQAYGIIGLPEIEDDYLIFASENQGVCSWSIAIDDIKVLDPPVFVNLVEDEWELESEYLSDLLIAMLFWQVVNGYMPYRATAMTNTGEILLPPGWQKISLPLSGEKGWGGDVFLTEGQLLYVSSAPFEDQLDIKAGALTEELFDALKEAFKFSWNDCSLDSE